jgi:hypothetical protein
MVFLLAKIHQEFDLTLAWNWEVRKKNRKDTSGADRTIVHNHYSIASQYDLDFIFLQKGH